MTVSFKHGVDVLNVDEQANGTIAMFPFVLSELNDHAHVRIVSMNPHGAGRNLDVADDDTNSNRCGSNRTKVQTPRRERSTDISSSGWDGRALSITAEQVM